MTRTYLGVLAGLGLTAGLGPSLDSRSGTGAVAGYLFGAAVGLLGLAWQHHAARTAPHHALRASTLSFGLKLAALLAGCLTLRFVEPVAEVADWKSFLLGCLGALLISLFLGSWEVARVLRARVLRERSAQ